MGCAEIHIFFTFCPKAVIACKKPFWDISEHATRQQGEAVTVALEDFAFKMEIP